MASANPPQEAVSSTATFTPLTGRCYCGNISYSISSTPLSQGMCYCRDCQRMSGSGFLPWIFVPASTFTLVGAPKLTHVLGASSTGSEKVVSRCGECGSSVFGGRYGIDKNHTVYAGTLDDDCVGRYEPKIAMFVRDRPPWAEVRVGLKEFDEMPVKS